MLAIKNNLMADNAARHLRVSYSGMAESVERLSSGLRINSAKDDAAGLAVRELVRSDIARLEQGARNARDGISMLQTAEGALAVIDDILIRMEMLAEQASTDTYSDTQKQIMEDEFEELSKEIDRIAENTKFNEVDLLNDDSGIPLQVHLGTTTTVAISGHKVDSETLSVGGAIESITGLSVDDPTDEYVDATAAGDEISFQFDHGTNGSKTITVEVSTDGMAAQEFVEAINTASRGEMEGWNAASIVENSITGQISVKIESFRSGTGTVTVNADADNGGNDVVWGTGTVLAGTAVAGSNFVAVHGSSTIDLLNSPTVALTQVMNAIEVKDGYRAEWGYLMNRLEAAISVIDIQVENLGAAESRISDVDVAVEMAQMTRQQVLSQAGISMLSQANTLPEMALQLLQ